MSLAACGVAPRPVWSGAVKNRHRRRACRRRPPRRRSSNAIISPWRLTSSNSVTNTTWSVLPGKRITISIAGSGIKPPIRAGRSIAACSTRFRTRSSGHPPRRNSRRTAHWRRWSFTPAMCMFLEENRWLHAIAQGVGQQPLPAALAPWIKDSGLSAKSARNLTSCIALFDWTVRNIQLEAAAALPQAGGRRPAHRPRRAMPPWSTGRHPCAASRAPATTRIPGTCCCMVAATRTSAHGSSCCWPASCASTW